MSSYFVARMIFAGEALLLLMYVISKKEKQN